MTRLLALVWPELRQPDGDPHSFEPMLDALDDLSPRIEAVDLGVALVDVTGLGPMWGPERRIAARAAMLARGVAPLHVRCGIGDNRWLASLAARLHVSRAALAKRFALLVGQPPMGYLRHLRLERVAELLRDPDVTLETAADAVGFSGAFALSATFKRECGMSPSAWRRAHGPQG